MSRPLRIEFPGAFYHLTARGNERKPIYRDDGDRERFVKILAAACQRFRVRIHAYVLMDNHYHLLLQTLEANLQRAMRAVNGTYAQAFNRRYGRVGHLFQGRYKALLVERDSYLVILSRYVHLNPVRAGIVARAEDYVWSSAPDYVGLRPAAPFVTRADTLAHFGQPSVDAALRYRQFLQEGITGASPMRRVVAQTLLGEPAWIERMRIRANACAAARRDARGSGEVPAVRQLRRRPTLAELMVELASEIGADASDWIRPGRSDTARRAAIYLAYTVCAIPQKQIGTTFGVGRFAVSKLVTRVERRLARDQELAMLIRRLTDALQNRDSQRPCTTARTTDSRPPSSPRR